jgi:hypothetical protein
MLKEREKEERKKRRKKRRKNRYRDINRNRKLVFSGNVSSALVSSTYEDNLIDG